MPVNVCTGADSSRRVLDAAQVPAKLENVNDESRPELDDRSTVPVDLAHRHACGAQGVLKKANKGTKGPSEHPVRTMYLRSMPVWSICRQYR